jgi:hypothetical protein
MRTVWTAAVVALVVSCVASGAGAAGAGEPVLGSDPLSALTLNGSDAAGAVLATVDVAGQPFAKAYRVRTTKRPSSPYAAQLTAPTACAVEKLDVLHLTFWLRCVEAAEQGEV